MTLQELLKRKEKLEADAEVLNMNIREVMEEINFIVSEPLKAARMVSGKDTGAVNLSFGNITVTQTIPKKVEWDEFKLYDISGMINDSGDKASNYIDIKTVYNVPEKKSAAWPEAIKKVFDPARTVKAGSPKLTFKIEGE